MTINKDNNEQEPVKLMWQGRLLLALWLVVYKKNKNEGVRFNFKNPLGYPVLLAIAILAGLLEGIIVFFRMIYQIPKEVISDALADK